MIKTKNLPTTWPTIWTSVPVPAEDGVGVGGVFMGSIKRKIVTWAHHILCVHHISCLVCAHCLLFFPSLPVYFVLLAMASNDRIRQVKADRREDAELSAILLSRERLAAEAAGKRGGGAVFNFFFVTFPVSVRGVLGDFFLDRPFVLPLSFLPPVPFFSLHLLFLFLLSSFF